MQSSDWKACDRGHPFRRTHKPECNKSSDKLDLWRAHTPRFLLNVSGRPEYRKPSLDCPPARASTRSIASVSSSLNRGPADSRSPRPDNLSAGRSHYPSRTKTCWSALTLRFLPPSKTKQDARKGCRSLALRIRRG